MLKQFQLLMAPNLESSPGFTQVGGAEVTENERDESDILADQDQTSRADNLTADDNMGAISNSLETLEDEPSDFMRGEIDVKEQMDRAADAMDTSIRGLQSHANEDSPRTEIGAAFQDTPGGLEEVEQKTDEDLARRKGFRQDQDPKHSPGHQKH